MKILIVKLSSIGDIVHTLPTLAAIRNALPSADISWVVEQSSAAILRGNPMLDALIEVDTRSLRKRSNVGRSIASARDQLKDLRASTFDVALDFQGLLKSAAIAKLTKAKKRFGFSKQTLREPASRFLLTDKINVDERTHVITKSLNLAKEALDIAIPSDNFEFPIGTGSEDRAEASSITEKSGERFAILNPAGGWKTKLWSAEKFGMLADRLWEDLGLVSVVSTAPNERDLAETVEKNSRTKKLIIAQPSLKGFYELARSAKVYVGGDTAPTHLAVAAKTPIVGIFGPTEWWRNGSPNAKDICVERTDIGCRLNCGRRTCGNWICMDISVETVFDAVKMRLEIGN
ncbi:MAG: lipopolysaccharide heptosyltransferase I [Pyrinomonadaceae bacterium]|nr:lipopolysaccharide heptosyltransferase I [Pyrinomonadaceae bacterium]